MEVSWPVLQQILHGVLFPLVWCAVFVELLFPCSLCVGLSCLAVLCLSGCTPCDFGNCFCLVWRECFTCGNIHSSSLFDSFVSDLVVRLSSDVVLDPFSTQSFLNVSSLPCSWVSASLLFTFWSSVGISSSIASSFPRNRSILKSIRAGRSRRPQLGPKSCLARIQSKWTIRRIYSLHLT